MDAAELQMQAVIRSTTIRRTEAIQQPTSRTTGRLVRLTNRGRQQLVNSEFPAAVEAVACDRHHSAQARLYWHSSVANRQAADRGLVLSARGEDSGSHAFEHRRDAGNARRPDARKDWGSGRARRLERFV